MSIFLVICFTTRAFSQCDNAVMLKKGDVVKDCDRVGYSLEYDKSVREDLVKGEYDSKIVEEQAKVITWKDLSAKTSEEQATLWKAEAIRERNLLDAEKNKGDKSLWLGIAMGILLTVGAGYAVGQVSKSSR